MDGKLEVQNSIVIIAPASKVWDALTNPRKTKKYMFGCEAISDWKPGSPLLWKGEYEGKEMVYVKGNIVEIDPGKYLSYTVFDPNSASLEDVPQNYLTVEYALSEMEGATTLNVTQGDFNTVGDGEKRYKDASNNGDGWNPVLEQIKKVVEEES